MADDAYLGGRTVQGHVTGSYVRAAANVFVDTRIAGSLRDRPAWADIAARTQAGTRLDVLAETPAGASVAPGTRVETRIAHSPKSKLAVLQESNRIVEIMPAAIEPAMAMRNTDGMPAR